MKILMKKIKYYFLKNIFYVKDIKIFLKKKKTKGEKRFKTDIKIFLNTKA